MATIIENLQILNEAKVAIKVAIENKGQDLTDVPFTQYAEKIDNIQAGNEAIIKPITITENGTYTAEDCDGYSPVTVEVQEKNQHEVVKMIVDAVGNANNFFLNSKLEDMTNYLHYDTMENAISTNGAFMGSSVERIPSMNFNKATNFTNMFNNATNLKEVGVLDTPKVTSFTQAFLNCTSLEKILGLDFRSCTGTLYMFTQTKNLTECYIKNIKTNVQVGSSSWGTLLSRESLIHLIKELRDTGTLLTLTIGSVNLEKLANIYVRTIEITDEMREQDDLIDEKLPFELCESTDEGAMLITDYVALKNWSLA